jgi:hypothetical protein
MDLLSGNWILLAGSWVILSPVRVEAAMPRKPGFALQQGDDARKRPG